MSLFLHSDYSFFSTPLLSVIKASAGNKKHHLTIIDHYNQLKQFPAT